MLQTFRTALSANALWDWTRAYGREKSASGKVRDQRDSALWDQLAEDSRSKHVARALFYAPAAPSAGLRTRKHGLPAGVKELQLS